jgi:hypothetical protein
MDALDIQSDGSDGTHVVTASDEGYLLAGCREQPAEIAANSAAAHHCYAHVVSVGRT